MHLSLTNQKARVQKENHKTNLPFEMPKDSLERERGRHKRSKRDEGCIIL